MHDQLPSDIVLPVVQAIMKNFVAEYCADEIIAAGLNGIREICARCPEAMSVEMLQDLSNFKGYQDKGVVMATRSLIALYRDLNPELLHKRDRGRRFLWPCRSTFVKRSVADAVHLDASAAIGDGLEGSVGDNLEGVVDVSDVEESDNDYNDNDDDNDGDNDDENDNDEENDDGDEAFETYSQVSEQDNTDYDLTTKKQSKVDIVRLAGQKILSLEETTLLRKRINNPSLPVNANNSDGEDSDTPLGTSSEVIDPRSLESTKKRKQDYAARMASIEAGREGRLKYGSKKGKHNEKASISNRIKQKRTKNAIMLAHKSSVRAKSKRSLRDKQKALQAHKKKQKIRR